MKEFQRAAVRLHFLHHAAQEPIYGAWMSEELAHHRYKISPPRSVRIGMRGADGHPPEPSRAE